MPISLARGRQATEIQGSDEECAMILLEGASEELIVDLRFEFEEVALRMVDESDEGGL